MYFSFAGDAAWEKLRLFGKLAAITKNYTSFFDKRKVLFSNKVKERVLLLVGSALHSQADSLFLFVDFFHPDGYHITYT